MNSPVSEVEEKGLRVLKEFREFVMKGNVVDLAVGVIIGAAFGGIVTSLVGDIIMPVIGAITGGLDFSNYFTALSKAVTANNVADAKKQGAVLAWGNFLTLTLNFIIVAFVLFVRVSGSVTCASASTTTDRYQVPVSRSGTSTSSLTV